EVLASLYRRGSPPDIINFIAGIGGRPVTEHDFIGIVKTALKLGKKGREMGTLYWGVRGVNY
ncbi:MAG: hypothetical protein QXV15_06185, partial [Acidilobaceae archaeon]